MTQTRDETRDPVRNGSDRNGTEREEQLTPTNASDNYDGMSDDEMWQEYKQTWGEES